MKNYNEIHLSDLINSLKNSYVKLNPEFLHQLFKTAAKGNNINRNKELAFKLDCPYNEEFNICPNIGSWVYKGCAIPFQALLRILELTDYPLDSIEKHIVFIKSGRKKGTVNIKFPIKIGKEIGNVVGHILGDGAIDKKYLQPFYTNSNIDLIKEFINNMDYIFGVKPRIWTQTKGNFKTKSKWLGRIYSFENLPNNCQIGLFYPRVCGLILYQICGTFAYGKKKQITEQIKNFNKEFKSGLIRAFFDDDGSINAESYTMRGFQDDKQLLIDIKSLLTDLDIESNEVHFYMKHGKVRHFFNITKRKNFLIYYNSIGFTSIKKQERLKLLSFGR